MIFGDIGYDAGIGKTDLNMKLLLGELYRDNVPTRLGTDTLSIQSVVSQYQQAQKSSQTVTVTKTVKPNETITKTATVTRTAPVNIDTTNTDSAIIAENNKKKSSSTSSKTVTASKISSASIVQQELAEAKRKGAKIAAASNTTEDDSGSILTSDMLQTRDFQTNSNEAKEGQDPHMVALQNWLAEQFESSEGFIEQENQEDEKLKKNKNIEESVEIAAENCLEPTEATLTVKNISDGHISVVEEQGTPPTEISIPIETPRLTEL